MRERREHYLPSPGPPDPELDRVPDPVGPVVFVNYIEEDEDYWSAVFLDGHAADSLHGPRETVVAWALQQPTSTRWIFDKSLSRYVPLEGPAKD